MFNNQEMEANLLLWDANNRADRAIKRTKNLIAKLNRRRINIPVDHGRRVDDVSKVGMKQS